MSRPDPTDRLDLVATLTPEQQRRRQRLRARLEESVAPSAHDA